MKFGSIKLSDAEGAVLAHRLEGFKKGHRLSAVDIQNLQARGIESATVAQFEHDDVPEDDAAQLIGRALVGQGAELREAATGRANIYATVAGLVRVNAAHLQAANMVHESLTVATLLDYSRVEVGQLLATIKVIPFAAPRWAVDKFLVAVASGSRINVKAFRKMRVALLITEVASAKKSLTHKSENAVRQRVTALGGEVVEVVVCNHDENSVAQHLKTLQSSTHDLILMFGAVAIVDRGDVIPAAVVACGGEVLHLGMPVDPGNLLMLAKLNGVAVVGVPTCARSPKENGFDWVLQRIACGIDVAPRDIQAMGVGGLLEEISTRPKLRNLETERPSVSAIVLAAGLSSRMGSNKLLARIDGVPMLRKTVERIIQSNVDDVIIVLGHQAEEVRAAVAGLDVRFVENKDFATGLSSSLRAGIAAVADADAAIICLGDMPLLESQSIDQIITTYRPREGQHVVVPQHDGKIGNPLLWGKKYFSALQNLEGDQGARSLLPKIAGDVATLDLADPGIHIDVDTKEALEAIRA